MAMKAKFLYLVVVLLGLFLRTSSSQTNRKYQICSHVGRPLVIGCGPQEFIYVSRVILSDWPWYTGRECDPPLCSQYCHVYNTNAGPFYNGRQMAEYTFSSEMLAQYKETYGHCNNSSTAKFVFIVYECLKENANSICETETREGDLVGFLVSPDFPRVNNMADVTCQCELEANNEGSLSLTGVLLNPYVDRGVFPWILKVTDDTGKHYDLSQEAGINMHLPVPMATKLTLTYTMGTGHSAQHRFYSHQPAGFWLRYTAFPTYSKARVQCYRVDKPHSISPSSVAAIVGSCVLFVAFLVSSAVFCRKRRVTECLLETITKKVTPKNKPEEERPESSVSVSSKQTHSGSSLGPPSDPKYSSLPVLYHGQNFKQFRLVELDPKRHCGKKKSSRKKRVPSIASVSSSGVSVTEQHELPEMNECEFYFAFDMNSCYFDGITDSEVNV